MKIAVHRGTKEVEGSCISNSFDVIDIFVFRLGKVPGVP